MRFVLFLLLFTAPALGQNTIASWNGDLFWDASPSSVAGYNIYKGSSGGPYSKVNSGLILGLSTNDSSGVANDCYVATAVAGSGLESVFSEEMCIVAPQPPLFLRIVQVIAAFFRWIFGGWA